MGSMLGLSLAETIVIGVVALLVFGHRLPEVAMQCAVQMQRLRRSLSDLRRESGVDRELRELRRTIEEASTPPVHPRRLLREARREVEQTLARPASGSQKEQEPQPRSSPATSPEKSPSES